MPIIITIFIISFAVKTLQFNAELNIRADDYLKDIKVNDISITSSYDKALHNTFQLISFDLPFGSTLKIYIMNNAMSPMGIAAKLKVYNLYYSTNSDTLWISNYSIPYNFTLTYGETEKFLGIDAAPANELAFYTINIPEYIGNLNCEIHTVKGSNRLVIQPLGCLKMNVETDSELTITFTSLPYRGLKYINHNGGSITPVALGTSYKFMENNIRYDFLSSDYNSYTSMQYYISNTTSRISNSGTITIVICQYEGTEQCSLQSGSIYYEKCNDDAHFYLTSHNYCLLDSNSDGYYLDQSNVYQYCLSPCATCSTSIGILFHNCLSCKSSFYPIDNIPSNCVSSSQVDSSFSLIDGKYVSDSHYIYQQGGQYHSTEDCWNTLTPFIYQGTNLCISNCAIVNRYIYNGYCLSECPNNYISTSVLNVCVEKSLTKGEEDGYYITNETKEYIIENMKYNVLIYSQIGTNFKGDDFTFQIYSSNSPPSEKDNISTISMSSCESVLRTTNNIQDTDELIIVKMDITREDSISNQVEYSVYTQQGVKLDLNDCKDTIDITYPISNNKTIINYDLANKLSKDNIDLFEPFDSFFTNSCYPFSINKTDIIVRDRQKLYNQIEICEEGCSLKQIDYYDNTIICSCSIKQSMSTVITNTFSTLSVKWNSTSDYEFLKCYKYIFKGFTYKKNIGFIVYLSILILNVIVFIMFFFDSNRLINRLASDCNKTVTEVKIKERLNLHILIKTRSNFKINNHEDKNIKDNSSSFREFIERAENQNTGISAKDENISSSEEEIDELSIVNNPFIIIYHIMKRKISLLRIIFNKKRYTLTTMDLEIYLIRIAINCFFNALFYNEHIISNKYLNKGKESISSIITIVILSNICSHFLILIINSIFSIQKFITVVNIANENLISSLVPFLDNIKASIYLRVITLFVCSILSIFFFIYYMTLYCYIYQYSQSQWMYNNLYSGIVSLCYTIAISFLMVILFIYAYTKESKHYSKFMVFVFYIM